MKWKEICVLTEKKCVEAVAGIFHYLGSGGVVIEDPQAVGKYLENDIFNPQSVLPDFLDHEFTIVKAYFHEDKEIMDEIYSGLEAVKKNFNNPLIKIFIDEVKNQDWEHLWKKYYHTFKVGDRLVIKPSWENYLPRDEELVIEIDPGMAFGTGIHASTRFCLFFIDQYVKGGEHIIDAGCGSGILSIGAAKLGACSVYAMDIDEVAVKVAQENIRLNHLEDVIKVEEGNIIELLRTQKADMIFANITAEVINNLIPEAAIALSAGGYLFASGIVDSRWPEVEMQLKKYGFTIEQKLNDVDWVGVAARKA
ncbi:MAG: 50S ribosomal protein L11 methyltransferase [Syntrophomonadaceae bacterium]|jgi:ribosomal protein L11 methyltransferase